jgi:GMP synthase-like glutamine amidotransferase
LRPGVVLQHERSGPPARFGQWLEQRSIPFETRLVAEDGLPADPAELPWICALGSDETPGTPGRPGWVDEEIGFLRRAIEADTPVLGLCFGGQALAAAAGARVAAADPPQVDWIEVETSDPDRIPAGPWLHFHYFQLHLPTGARELAHAPAGTAAFELGPHLGLQFHPEATAAIADGWAAAEAATLLRLGIDLAGLAESGRAAEPAAAEAADRLFDAWWLRASPSRR